MGIVRHADAGYERAIDNARRHGIIALSLQRGDAPADEPEVAPAPSDEAAADSAPAPVEQGAEQDGKAMENGAHTTPR